MGQMPSPNKAGINRPYLRGIETEKPWGDAPLEGMTRWRVSGQPSHPMHILKAVTLDRIGDASARGAETPTIEMIQNAARR